MYFLKFLTNIQVSIFLLFIISILSSIGSVIEQEKSLNYYFLKYPSINPIFGFIDYNFILFFGLNHIYQTFYFLAFIFLLFLSLLSCTFMRQLPIVSVSKKYAFKNNIKNFYKLPFIKILENIYFFLEYFIPKIQVSNFFIYQKQTLLYCYKGLISRVSPILVHFSLILILLGTSLSSFESFKTEEFISQGEIYNFQNFLTLGYFTSFPTISFRLNDFWIEYNKSINQFYTNLSILDNYGKEIINNTLSVNNPLFNNNIYFYQNEWILIAIRLSEKYKNFKLSNILLEYPVFPITKNFKFWISFINEKSILIFDNFKHNYYFYSNDLFFIKENVFYKNQENKFIVIESIPTSGLLIKYDFAIKFIYLGFGFLILTTFLSYLPYYQFWVLEKKNKLWMGGLTNRSKGKGERFFENFLRKR
jgi:cytochrome c biogenesis protein